MKIATIERISRESEMNNIILYFWQNKTTNSNQAPLVKMTQLLQIKITLFEILWQHSFKYHK